LILVHTPHPTSRRSILIIFSYLRLSLPSGLFPSGFPTKTLHTPLLSPTGATCPAHLMILFITRTVQVEEYKSVSSSSCSFLHSPVTSSLLSPNILHSTLFSNNPSLHSFLNVSDQVSHPYNTIGRIKILYDLNIRGPGSVVGIATGYGVDGPGIESRWGRDFPHLSRPTLGPTQFPVQWVPRLSRG
jgi:hypothetical protein